MSTSQNEEIFTTWTTEIDDLDSSVVYMCGELDASSAPVFLTDMQKIVSRRRNIIMDVHLLEYVDSTGIAAIFSTKNALEQEGQKMCLAGCHGLLTKILHAIRVEQELTCYDDVDEAIANIEKWHVHAK